MDNFNRHTALPIGAGTSGDVIFYDGTVFTGDFVFGKGVYFSNGVNWLPMISFNHPKKYKALLTQTGTNVPTAVVLENSIGGTFTFARSAAGEYSVNNVGQFTVGKTVVNFGNEINDAVTNYANISVLSTVNDIDNVYFNVFGDTSVAVDEALLNTTIEIIVYP